jgi:succinyl-diaminopimelate desuccinylase
VQGHVAYPHRADNPIPKLARVVSALEALHLDDGNEASSRPTSRSPTCAPATAPPTSSRHRHHPAQHPLQQPPARRGSGRAGPPHRRAAAPGSTVEAKISGEAFLTPAGPIYEIVREAIRAETGIEPQLSTHGGTSDGRFLIALCPVIDFGLPNATMHKLDEAAAVEDIRQLERIYARVIRGALGSR